METKIPEEIVPGIYQHYKGPLYHVLGLARHANTEGEMGIVYCSVEPHGDESPMWNYRPLTGEDGFFVPAIVDGKEVERFKFLYPVNSTKTKRPKLQ